MPNSCPCNGSNENCSRCFGSGSYTPQDTSSKRSRKRISVVRGVVSSSRFSLEKGKGSGPDIRITGPLPLDQKKGDKFKPKRVQRALLWCVLCESKNFLEPEKLASHLREYHRVASRLSKRITDEAKNKGGIGCWAVQDHSEDHEKAPSNMTNRSSSPKQQISLGKNALKSVAPATERPESAFDATKNYGFPCRELGRYGSSPAHDGYDDESSA
jgi:hypothetical protein